MKIPARIIAPITLAFVCAAILMGFLWWQLNQSTSLLNITPKTTQTGTVVEYDAPTTVTDPYGDKALIHMRQGDLLALKGDWAGAQSEYEGAVSEGGGLPALRKLAQAQLQRRDMDGVKSSIKKMRSAGAKAEDILLLESIMNLRTGELVKAKRMLETAKESPQKHYGLVLLSIVEGDHIRAQEELNLVTSGWEPILRSYAKTLQAAYDEFALFPESPDIHLITLLSRALAQVQECELALPLLVQVTGKKDDYRDAWIVQGYCELTTERFAQALASLEQAYTIDPQKPETQYFLGRTYAALGDPVNAITFFEYSVVNGFQPESEVRHYIAAEALKSENGQLALEQYAILTRDENATLDSFETLIETSMALEQYEEAYVSAGEAALRWPDKGKAYELLGIAALALDADEEALEAFQKAVELDPFLTVAKEKLEELKGI